jgi:hypothetical protein
MFQDNLSLQAYDRIDQMRHEAEVYRRWIDAAPLTFREHHPVRDARRAVAGVLNQLAGAIAP